MPSSRSVAGLALACVLAAALGCGEPASPASETPFAGRPPPVLVAGLQVALAKPGRVGDPDEPRARGAQKWIVQLAGPVHDEQKHAIEDAGGRIGDYLPDFAFVVSLDREARRRVEALPFVSGIARMKPDHRVAPSLRAGGRTGALRLHLRADDAEALQAVLAHVNRRGGKVLDVGTDVARVELHSREVAALSSREDVVWIEPAGELRLVNDTTRWVIQSNVSPQTPIWSGGLRGEGQIIGIGDSGVDHDMPWFRDPSGATIGPGHRKIVLYDATYGDASDADEPGHGTHVAGTAGGDRGPVDGGAAGNGMAPKARFAVQDLTKGAGNWVDPPSDLGALFITAYESGARLHTNSWGGFTASYTIESQTADRFAWEHPDFLPLFANGNEGSSPQTVIYPATAKNVVSVGATLNGAAAGDVTSFSSHGPTADGRIKPTLTAPGDGATDRAGILSADSDGTLTSFNAGLRTMSGTSMATPAVAGAAALVRQFYVEGRYPSGLPVVEDAFTPSAALVKATLVASAEDMSGAYTAGPAPSMGQGFGRVNLSRTIPLAGSGGLEVVEGSGLVTGGAWSREFLVSGARPLKATLVWTDAPGASGASRALVNDLDLVVTAPDGRTYHGNAFADGRSDPDGSPDRLNVEEVVVLPAPTAGYYQVAVSAYNVPNGPQPFALVLTGTSAVGSLGAVMLDRHRYMPAGLVNVLVADADLDGDPAVRDPVVVRVLTASEPAGEPVELVETGASTGVFAGAIRLVPGAATPGDGVVGAQEGDWVRADYEDADGGTGPGTRTATATVDGRPPVISGTTSEVVWEGGARMRWTTDEPATSIVEHGPTPGLGLRAEGRRLSMDHDFRVEGLVEATTYLFDVLSEDEAGNVGRDDAGGQHYTFTTPSAPPTLNAASSEPFTTGKTRTLVFGTARDATLVGVTLNGVPVPVRATDGYFAAWVDLALGYQEFTVVAADSVGNQTTVTVGVNRIIPSDLVVEAFTVPSVAGTGTTVDATVTVSNVGEAQVFCLEYDYGYCYVTFFCRPVGSGELGTPAGRITLPGYFGPGESVTRTFPLTVPIGMEAGVYVLEAWADYQDWVPESDESNNRRVSSPFTMLLPDLEWTELGASTPAFAGAETTVHTLLSNVGLGVSNGLYASVYLSSDETLSLGINDRDTGLGWWVPGPLQPGSSLPTDFPVTLPHDRIGRQYLIATTSQRWDWPFYENDDENNTRAVPIDIVGPNLTPISVSAPSPAGTGQPLTITDSVHAAAGGAPGRDVQVAFFLSRDQTISGSDDDLYLGARIIPSIAAGETNPGTTTVTVPYGISGSYRLGAIVDWGQWIPESNESDNVVLGNEIVIAMPDLTVASFSAPAPSVLAGATISATDVAANVGSASVAGFAVGYYLSVDDRIGLDDVQVGLRWAGPLGPGEESGGTASVRIPPGLFGRRHLGAYADSDWSRYDGEEYGGPMVPESDEANNASSAVAVEIIGSDIAVTQVSGPATVVSGSNFTVRTSVTNAASAGTAGLIAISVRASPDPVITADDRAVSLDYALVPQLAPGASASVDVRTYLSPSRYPVGTTVYLGALASNPEENLADNAAVGPLVTVVAP